jgi:hypothetical protein
MASSCPALKMATVAMLILFAGQLLAATPADGRVLPAAGRRLLEDKEKCVGPLCDVGCRLICPLRCVLQSDGTEKCKEFCFNDCT